MCHCEVVELFAVVDALFTQLCPFDSGSHTINMDPTKASQYL